MDVADLRDARGLKANDAAGGETKYYTEDDGGGGAGGREPETEDDERGEEGHGEEHGEAAQVVGEEGRDGPAKCGCCVEDGDEIDSKGVRDAALAGREDDECEGEEEACVRRDGVSAMKCHRSKG